MIRQNYLKEKLRSGKPVLGTWAVIPSTVTADIMASAGLDFIIIDAEHGPINFETAQNMVIACESRGVSPVMRVGNLVEGDILKALDIGIHCLQMPNIKTREDVELLIKYSKYPPAGERGFSPFTRSGNYSIHNATTLTAAANENSMLAINVEGKEALDSIDEILKLKELDIVFIGLFDLSKALGIPGQVSHPDVMNYLKILTDKVNAAGKYPGTIVTNPERLQEFYQMGLKYLVYLVDCDMLRNSYQQVTDQFNTLKNEQKIQGSNN